VAAIGDYLDAGGSPATLANVLSAWDARPASGSPTQQADLTGDGLPEIVVFYEDPLSETIPRASRLAIYTCQSGGVHKIYSYYPGEWLGLASVGVEDLTADGVADLAFTELSCGAHTCWSTLHVWSWNGVDFSEQVGGDFTLPYAIFALEDARVLATSGGIGSVGAGPQRAYTETWAWNGSVITLSTSQVGPARYRYHAFQDGDEALFRSEFDSAYWSYMTLLTDNTLISWEGFYGAEEERRWLAALAHWRLVLMGLKLENYADAEAHYERLQEGFPPHTPGHAVTVLAELFWDRYLEVGNIAYGCEAFINTPEAVEVLDFLNSYGYANPTYTKEALCPYLTP